MIKDPTPVSLDSQNKAINLTNKVVSLISLIGITNIVVKDAKKAIIKIIL